MCFYEILNQKNDRLESAARRPPLHISHCWRGSQPFLLCLKCYTTPPRVAHKYVIWWMQFSRKLWNTQCARVDGNPVIRTATFSGSNHGIKNAKHICKLFQNFLQRIWTTSRILSVFFVPFLFCLFLISDLIYELTGPLHRTELWIYCKSINSTFLRARCSVLALLLPAVKMG